MDPAEIAKLQEQFQIQKKCRYSLTNKNRIDIIITIYQELDKIH